MRSALEGERIEIVSNPGFANAIAMANWLQEYSEIVLCRCKYDPIPREWSRVKRGTVTVDFFGGDVEAFET